VINRYSVHFKKCQSIWR